MASPAPATTHVTVGPRPNPDIEVPAGAVNKDHWYHVSLLSCLAEFLGTLLFAFYGAFYGDGFGAVTNGLALAVLVYATASISGGHLNPWVTFATVLTGHTALLQGVSYILCQCVGAIVGAAITKGLRPAGAGDVGCFGPSGISRTQLWGWETINTFLLVSTIYAVAISQKGSGNMAPLVIGLSLLVAALSSGALTGAALNIARVLGPSVVYGCWDSFWIYLLAGLTGSGLAAGWGFMTNVAGPFSLAHNAKGFFSKQFVRSTPYSTATDPLVHYTALSSNDQSLAPYAKITGPRLSVPARELHKRTLENTPPVGRTVSLRTDTNQYV